MIYTIEKLWYLFTKYTRFLEILRLENLAATSELAILVVHFLLHVINNQWYSLIPLDVSLDWRLNLIPGTKMERMTGERGKNEGSLALLLSPWHTCSSHSPLFSFAIIKQAPIESLERARKGWKTLGKHGNFWSNFSSQGHQSRNGSSMARRVCSL